MNTFYHILLHATLLQVTILLPVTTVTWHMVRDKGEKLESIISGATPRAWKGSGSTWNAKNENSTQLYWDILGSVKRL